jgi:hypothetical protein
MRPINDDLSEVERVEFDIQEELGAAIRISTADFTREPLSNTIVMLMLQLALEEALKTIVREEAAAVRGAVRLTSA